jgi:hypothetical protein
MIDLFNKFTPIQTFGARLFLQDRVWI